MAILDESNVIIEALSPEWYKHQAGRADVLRLDLLHPIISGNKWYKLKLNIEFAVANGLKRIVTFGGGHSNHLAATAYTAKLYGLKAVGIVRGHYPQLTPTLEACKSDGMELMMMSKGDYDAAEEKSREDEFVFGDCDSYVIPEGGANELGRTGAGMIAHFCSTRYTHIALSVGSGTTFAGIRNNMLKNQKLLGFVPIKGGKYLNNHIAPYTGGNNENWELFDDWHFGGFGKWDSELINFMNDFYKIHSIPLDIIYTSKMMYGIRKLIMQGHFNSYDRILCIHTGGLQGNASIKNELTY